MKVSQQLVTSLFDTGRYFIFPLFLECTLLGLYPTFPTHGLGSEVLNIVSQEGNKT
jgi:hypothetical protein